MDPRFEEQLPVARGVSRHRHKVKHLFKQIRFGKIENDFDYFKYEVFRNLRGDYTLGFNVANKNLDYYEHTFSIKNLRAFEHLLDQLENGDISLAQFLEWLNIDLEKAKENDEET